MEYTDKIKKLTKSLFPTGRAFKLFTGGSFEKLIEALNESENRAYKDALSILNSILPDNDNFTEEDATDWERRLGLISNPLVDLADRKLAIKRKMNHPGDIPARQNYLYLERELQAAGFNLYVYENRFDDGMGGFETHAPSTELPGSSIEFQLNDFQLNDNQLGTTYMHKVVNNMSAGEDALFDDGSNFRSTFFVCGSPIGTIADVDADREKELRQLILRIKPVQTIGYLGVNYI